MYHNIKCIVFLASIILFFADHTAEAQLIKFNDKTKWKLSDGKGEWKVDKQTRTECLTITGSEGRDDSNYWKYDYKFEPGQVYKLTCQVKTSLNAEGNNILIGSNLVNRDIWVKDSWEQQSLIFRTPDRIDNSYLRFGQWHVKGTVWFRDIALVKVQPVHSLIKTVALGSGELIEGRRYRAAFNFQGIESNYSRCLESYNATFNTNRFVMNAENHVVFKHILGDGRSKTQKSGELTVNLGHYTRGTCLIEASTDGSTWRRVGTIEAKQEKTMKVPSSLYPANQVFIRLSASGVMAAFQIYSYVYTADLSIDLPEFAGSTDFIEISQQEKDVEVRVESLGEENSTKPAVVHVRNTSTHEQTYEIEYSTKGKISRKQVTLAAGKTQTVAIQPDDEAGTDAKRKLIVKKKGSRGSAFEAEAILTTPYIQRSNYGHLIGTYKDVTLWLADATYKINRSRPAPTAPISERVRLCAARNEYEPVQLVIRPNKDLKSVRITTTAFKSEKGDVIPAQHIELFLVDYVPIEHPTDKFGSIGLWPDPLPPIDKPFSVEKNKNQPIWILVYVPPGTKAGEYFAEVQLSASGWKHTIPLQLEVWDFTLPRENHLKSSFGFQPSNVTLYHHYSKSDDSRILLDKYYESFAKHRISPYNPFGMYEIKETFDARNLDANLDFSKFDPAMKKYFKDYGFTTFRTRISGLGSGTYHARNYGSIAGFKQQTTQYEKLMSNYLRKLQRNFEERNLLDKAYIYWFDEPEKKDYDFIVETNKLIKKAAPKIDILLTEQPEPELYGHVDIWCPLLSNYDHDVADQRRKKGEKFWWYICTVPKAPYPTLFIDHDAVELRTWIWMSWKYNIEGILIWNTNYWTSNAAYPSPKLQNPYQDPMSYKSGYDLKAGEIVNWGNGDGRFIYPPKTTFESKKPCHQGPVSSIRWEMLREGMEDYEYFWLLRDAVQKAQKNRKLSSLIKEANSLLNVPETIVRSMTEYTSTPESIYNHRQKLANMIIRLQKEL